MSRCCPFVTPGLPPTGVAGVGSLKPSLGPSATMIVMCAFAAAGAGVAMIAASASASESGRMRAMDVVMASLLSARRRLLREERDRVIHRADAAHVVRAVLVRPGHQH